VGEERGPQIGSENHKLCMGYEEEGKRNLSWQNQSRGFEQREGLHYDGTSISAPVSNKMVIRIVLILMIMAGWVGEILDVQGAFLHLHLHGELDKGEEIHMEVPQGFEKHYDPMYYVLLLMKTMYGLKQLAF
jgi:hypothetical protein